MGIALGLSAPACGGEQAQAPQVQMQPATSDPIVMPQSAPPASAHAATPPPRSNKKAIPFPKDCCKGKNECKGKSGCKTDSNSSCAGKNDCKGKGTACGPAGDVDGW